MFLALLCGMLLAGQLGWQWPAAYWWAIVIAMGLVGIGVLDDNFDLPVIVRLGLYFLSCISALIPIFGPVAAWSPMLWLATPAILVGLLWLLNLYNFMDGIDGLAATQCILAASAAGLIAIGRGADPHYGFACLLLVGSQAGFLLWNWGPARLFMGDAGSVPSGFLLGFLALLGASKGYLPISCWLILLAAFVTDATTTLVYRALTGQRVTSAHRTHAYQRLSRAFASHQKVVLLLLGIHIFWLLPLAMAASEFPGLGISLVILAYIPLLLGMAKAMRLG